MNCRQENKPHELVLKDSEKPTDFKCTNCDVDVSIIPKDCIVCDTCNQAVSDGNFIATETAYWYQHWLYCSKCHTKINELQTSEQPHELKMKIIEGDNLTNTELAKPIVMEFG